MADDSVTVGVVCVAQDAAAAEIWRNSVATDRLGLGGWRAVTEPDDRRSK